MKDNIRTLLENSPQPLYSQDGVPEAQKRVIFTAVHPGSLWTWTAYEADQVEMDDIMAFGRVDGFESELGYFSVDELIENGVIFEINSENSLQSDETMV